MNAETAAVVNLVIGAVNLALLIGIAFQSGRWMGRVETRLDHLEATAFTRREL